VRVCVCVRRNICVRVDRVLRKRWRSGAARRRFRAPACARRRSNNWCGARAKTRRARVRRRDYTRADAAHACVCVACVCIRIRVCVRTRLQPVQAFQPVALQEDGLEARVLVQILDAREALR
jgi:hypothetical protein